MRNFKGSVSLSALALSLLWACTTEHSEVSCLDVGASVNPGPHAKTLAFPPTYAGHRAIHFVALKTAMGHLGGSVG